LGQLLLKSNNQIGASFRDGFDLFAGSLGFQKSNLIGVTVCQASERFEFGVKFGRRGIVVGEQRSVPPRFKLADLSRCVAKSGAGIGEAGLCFLLERSHFNPPHRS
jgi:hypothetical protein